MAKTNGFFKPIINTQLSRTILAAFTAYGSQAVTCLMVDFI